MAVKVAATDAEEEDLSVVVGVAVVVWGAVEAPVAAFPVAVGILVVAGEPHSPSNAAVILPLDLQVSTAKMHT
ncbi:unnamed protein product [Aphanomyces euteiches]